MDDDHDAGHERPVPCVMGYFGRGLADSASLCVVHQGEIPMRICVTFAFACSLMSCVAEQALDPAEEQSAVVVSNFCTSSANCLYGPPVTCTGYSLCPAGVDETPGQRGYAECDGTLYYCPLPAAACYYNGSWYDHGKKSTLGSRCSSKIDGYCVGGVRDGECCVGSGECYAVCNDGTWEPDLPDPFCE